MSRDEQLECQRRAEVAMQMAIAARGYERHVWVRMALLWQSLGNDGRCGANDARAIVPHQGAPHL